jgi:hypothetical protein
MTWPTDTQFEQATNHGIEYALGEIANGNAEPQDGPLSGEWADGLTPQMVARNVGYTDDDGEAITELADAWEGGYNSAWQSHLDAHRGEQS